jgi:hypothetical protein
MWQEKDGGASKPLLSTNNTPTKRFRSLHEEPRTCNDLLFVILFALCCAGMAIISGVAFKRGDPSLLIPSNSKEFIDKYAEPTVQGWFTNAVAQAKMDSDILIGSVALAVVLGFVWVQMMKTFTKLFI